MVALRWNFAHKTPRKSVRCITISYLQTASSPYAASCPMQIFRTRSFQAQCAVGTWRQVRVPTPRLTGCDTVRGILPIAFVGALDTPPTCAPEWLVGACRQSGRALATRRSPTGGRSRAGSYAAPRCITSDASSAMAEDCSKPSPCKTERAVSNSKSEVNASSRAWHRFKLL